MVTKLKGVMKLVVLIIFISTTWQCAQAQSAGSTVVSLGWARINPISSSDPLKVTSIGGQPADVTETGTSAKGVGADTVGLTLEYYVTDNIGVATVGGFPVYLNLEGSGTLSNFGVLGKARPWAPQLILRYHFLSAQSRFRPFVGVGANYTWFTNARATNSDFVMSSFGPGGSASVKASTSWNPVFEIGTSYQIDRHWSVGFSLSYIPVSTNLTLTGRTAAGTEVVSHARLRLRPINTFLSASYCF